MSQHNVLVILALCLFTSSVLSAPAEDTTTTAAPATTTTAAPSDKDVSSTAAPTSATPESDKDATASMAVSSAQDHAHVGNTSFTCFNRSVGYYADTEADCKVYHFCMLGDYNGQEVYQRVSYLCLNETVFDQQALDCVETSKMTAPCADSPKFYDDSNAILRKAIIGKPSVEEHEKKEEENKST